MIRFQAYSPWFIGNFMIFVLGVINYAFSQNALSVDSLSRVITSEHTSSVWGLTHSSGKEIGLLGTRSALKIYDLTDPTHPLEIRSIAGNSCIWRELKTNNDFIYVVTECEDGLLIIDCRDLMDIKFKHQFDFTNGIDSISAPSSHTLFIDEKSYLYLSGTSEGAGYICLDLNKDPMNPEFVSRYTQEYFHEAFVLRDTIYGASLYLGEFTVMDIKDRKNPILLARQKTGFHFTHSVWREKNNAIIYTADESSGAFVEAWDISDLKNIKLLDKFRPNFPTDNYSIPHNIFFNDNYLYISWYTEGVRILDVSNRKNIVEVGFYDTHPQANYEFNGVWNVYPFFKSGVCLASDIENGMFVFRFNKNTASYLEGKVTDKSDSSEIIDAKVQITGHKINTSSFTNLSGEYSTGASMSEQLIVEVSKAGYYTINDTINLLPSGVLVIDYELMPLPKYNVSIGITFKSQFTAEENVKVRIWNSDFTYEAISNASGEATLYNIIEGVYHLQTSKWGRLHYSVDSLKISASIPKMNINLESGYEDQFNFDEHWQILPDTQKLKWKIGNFSELFPKPSNYPSQDIKSDIGDQALYTANFDDLNWDINVKGNSFLISPLMDLSMFDFINLKYTAWAYGGWENSIKESYLLLNDDIIPIEGILEDLSGNWNPGSDLDLVLSKERTKCYFIIHLFNDPDHLTEAIPLKAAIDGFKVIGGKIGSVANWKENIIDVYPNPIFDLINFINSVSQNFNLAIYNSLGVQIQSYELKHNEKLQINLTDQLGSIFYYKIIDKYGNLVQSDKIIRIKY